MASENQGSKIPLIEVYWSLVDKADRKFSKIRELPFDDRIRFETYFYKVFQVYTNLWKFQHENRQRLVEAGLKRWQIGEIGSRIAQLYFGQYMRTSDAHFLSESYTFYEAILAREYFKEGLFEDLGLTSKQLRLFARFMMVCLLVNRREMVHQLVDHMKILLHECKEAFPESSFGDWTVVIEEIERFLKADTTFMNTRPLRYSIVLDAHPDTLPQASSSSPKRILRLRDAILCSYHPNEVKFNELTLDSYRMLQCLEWEPSGLFYKPGGAVASGDHSISQHGIIESTGVSYSIDLKDPTLPPNPRKAILFRPSVTHFLVVLATACEELPVDGVLLIYLSGRSGQASSSAGVATSSLGPSESTVKELQSLTIDSAGTSQSDSQSPSHGQTKEVRLNFDFDCLQVAYGRSEGSNCIYPSDLLPFTRRPLFLIVDSESSGAFKMLSGAERGEPAAMLLSPTTSPPIAADDVFNRISGSLFTIFLTGPVEAFCLLLGFSSSHFQLAMCDKAEKLLTSSLNEWGLMLASSGTLDPVWAQVFSDPFLRRLLLRFIFCRAVLTLYLPTSSRPEFIPQCTPPLPGHADATNIAVQSVVLQIANIFGAAYLFSH